MTKLHDIYFEVLKNDQLKYTIVYLDGNQPRDILIVQDLWNNSGIVNALIRSKYSQDRVEAIINNHFLNIAEWLDKKFKGEDVKFEDPEYDELQEWRKICKQWAKEALEKYPPTN